MKTFFFCLLAFAGAYGSAAAQIRDTLAIRNNGENIQIAVVSARNQTELSGIKLKETSFPVTLIPSAALEGTISLFNKKDDLSALLRQENQAWRYRDTLNMRESQTLNNIIQVQKEHVRLCEATNEQLNRSIVALNTQLSETRQLAADCNKGKVRRSMWGVALGGGIGFGLGVILGIIAAK